jgi:hypothetical protein
MSAKFPVKLDYTPFRTLVNGIFADAIRLNRDFFYKDSKYVNDTIIHSGFTSDGASVPSWFWRIFPPFGKYLEAAVVHDHFCVLGHAGNSPIDSKVAALVFREAMKSCNISKWKISLMYSAVKWFGPKFKSKIKNA